MIFYPKIDFEHGHHGQNCFLQHGNIKTINDGVAVPDPLDQVRFSQDVEMARQRRFGDIKLVSQRSISRIPLSVKYFLSSC
jgi:hypothetical protein